MKINFPDIFVSEEFDGLWQTASVTWYEIKKSQKFQTLDILDKKLSAKNRP